MKLLMTDLDGTVRRPLTGREFIQHPHDQQIILAAYKAMNLFYNSGYRIVGISNQGGVGAKFKSLEACVAEMKFFLQLAPIVSRIYFCPCLDGREVWQVGREKQKPRDTKGFPSFRKPSPGMLKLAMEDYKVVAKDCLYVGDRQEDSYAADSASVPFLWASEFRSGAKVGKLLVSS